MGEARKIEIPGRRGERGRRKRVKGRGRETRKGVMRRTEMPRGRREGGKGKEGRMMVRKGKERVKKRD